MCVLFGSANMNIKGAKTIVRNRVRVRVIFIYFFGVHLQYSKVPIGVRVPPFENHWSKRLLVIDIAVILNWEQHENGMCYRWLEHKGF